MSIPVANKLTGHPMLFQRPEWDKALNASPELLHSTDPNVIWIPSTKRSQRKKNSINISRLRERYVPLITTIREMPTLLYNSFFCQENITYLQRAMQLQVKQVSGYSVPLQDVNSLLIFMTNFYVDNARPVNEDTSSIVEIINETRKEIRRLNAIVLLAIVPTVIVNVESLKRTTEKIENPAKDLMPMSVSTSIKGTIQYRPVDDVMKASN